MQVARARYASSPPVTRLRTTAPQQREFGCPQDYDAINMVPFEDVVKRLIELGEVEAPAAAPAAAPVN